MSRRFPSSLGEHRGRAFNADALAEVGGVVGKQLAGSATYVEKPVAASKMQKFLAALLRDSLGRGSARLSSDWFDQKFSQSMLHCTFSRAASTSYKYCLFVKHRRTVAGGPQLA